jgi:hypothetical protein
VGAGDSWNLFIYKCWAPVYDIFFKCGAEQVKETTNIVKQLFIAKLKCRALQRKNAENCTLLKNKKRLASHPKSLYCNWCRINL